MTTQNTMPADELAHAAQMALKALKENNQHHVDFDDHGGYLGSELEGTNAKAIAALEVALQSARSWQADTDVRSIMLDVVPGSDGMGVEVYAKTVDDVVNKLAELGEQVELLRFPVSGQDGGDAGGERVYLVATGEQHEGQETYTRHDVRPPLCDAEVLYTTPQPAAVPATQAEAPVLGKRTIVMRGCDVHLTHVDIEGVGTPHPESTVIVSLADEVELGDFGCGLRFAPGALTTQAEAPGMTDALLPCPLCAGAAEVEDHRLCWSVICKSCGCCVIGDRSPELHSEEQEAATDWGALRDSAIKRWNKRNALATNGAAVSAEGVPDSIRHLASVAIAECPSSPAVTDWEEAALKVCAYIAAAPAATVQGAGQAVEQLRRDFARECVDTDTLLRLLDFKPDEVRTDGGSLNLPRLASLIEARKGRQAAGLKAEVKFNRELIKQYTDEARGLLDEAYRFAAMSPKGQENINCVSNLLDDIDAALAAQGGQSHE